MAAKVNKDSCIGCGACAGGCPVEAITVDAAAEVNADACIDCGACVSTCPVGAITQE
ncbi:MAG: 4Fe-4S binding protein [Erysipelotrichaceae bacterium]|nr:4Fe-4S binding protein [Erysipelotrichaceae bacterium]